MCVCLQDTRSEPSALMCLLVCVCVCVCTLSCVFIAPLIHTLNNSVLLHSGIAAPMEQNKRAKQFTFVNTFKFFIYRLAVDAWNDLWKTIYRRFDLTMIYAKCVISSMKTKSSRLPQLLHHVLLCGRSLTLGFPAPCDFFSKWWYHNYNLLKRKFFNVFFFCFRSSSSS